MLMAAHDVLGFPLLHVLARVLKASSFRDEAAEYIHVNIRL